MPEKRLAVSSLPRADIDFDGLAEALKPLSNPTRLKLLHYLTRPHYLEEIASELKMSRQAAQKHVDQLLELGVVKKQQGSRESGPVVEYILVPQRIFAIGVEFDKLGVLKPTEDLGALERTTTGAAVSAAPGGAQAGGLDAPHLVIVHGMKVGAQFPLIGKDGAWLIGRDSKAPVTLDYDPFVSNRHAEVRRAEDGSFVLVDAFSTNGTMLNWQQLDRGERVPLRTGDVIGIGKSLLLFRAD